jgi:hypothetical protein
MCLQYVSRWCFLGTTSARPVYHTKMCRFGNLHCSVAYHSARLKPASHCYHVVRYRWWDMKSNLIPPQEDVWSLDTEFKKSD